MEQVIYERPREKLQNRGVKSLTNVELIQLVIGSGGKQSSAARIAKQVVQVLDNHGKNSMYQQLIAIKGLGEAKACQLLAAFELGQRYISGFSMTKLPAIPVSHPLETVQRSSKRKVIVSTLTGDASEIKQYVFNAFTLDIAFSVIKRMFTYALHDKAHSLSITMGFRNQPLTPTDDETMVLVAKIFQTSELLGVMVDALWLVNSNDKRLVNRRWLSVR